MGRSARCGSTLADDFFSPEWYSALRGENTKTNPVFDLFSYTLNYRSGKDQGEVPGLLVQAAPRKTARNREKDFFFALLTIPQGFPISEPEKKELLQKAAHTYYETGGSFTTGLRSAALVIHEALLAKSRRVWAGSDGQRVLLNLGVVHQDVVFLVHAGATSSLLMRKMGVEIFAEPQGDEPTFGVAEAPDLRYYQVRLEAGETVVFSPRLPVGWTPQTLAGLPSGSGREALRRRLLAQSSGEVLAAIFQVQPGTGTIHPLMYRPGIAAETPAEGSAPGISQPAGSGSTPRQEAIRPAENPVLSPDIPVSRQSRASDEIEPGNHRDQMVAPVLRRKVARAGIGAAGFLQTLGRKMQTLLGRVLPTREDETPGISTATMFFIAIAVPLVVIAIAATVYVRTGRTNIHSAYMARAQEIALQAVSQVDPALQRTAWEEVLIWVDKAEKYGETDESTALRQQAQTTLDTMDAIRRLTYQPALAVQLDSSIQVVKLVSTREEDLYALDSSGRVHRLIYSNPDYDVDTKFNCASGAIGMVTVGPLVDIVTLPQNNPHRAAIMGIDGAGNLLFCSPDKGPEAASLTPPSNLWGEIKSIAISADALDILDTRNNNVLRYEGMQTDFQGQPRDYFDQDRPADLSTVIEITASDEYLFLLHQDSRMTVCQFRTGMTKTRCDDPLPYHMVMTGQTDAEVTVPPAQFMQLQITQPPEPSLYILDVSGAAVYHFSHKLNMKQQFRADPQDPWLPEDTVSAFVVTPGRRIILAYANRLYFATLP